MHGLYYVCRLALYLSVSNTFLLTGGRFTTKKFCIHFAFKDFIMTYGRPGTSRTGVEHPKDFPGCAASQSY